MRQALDRYVDTVNDVRRMLRRRRLTAYKDHLYYYDQAAEHLWMVLSYLDEIRRREGKGDA